MAISAPIKVFRLDLDRFKNLPDTENNTDTYPPLSTAERSSAVPELGSSVPSVNKSPIRYTFCDAPFHYPVQCEHSLTHPSQVCFQEGNKSNP